MRKPPLLLLAAALAAAPVAAQTQGGSDPGQSSLRDQGFDVTSLSPAALKAAQADPEGFARRNRAAYQRFQAWRADPQKMLDADRREPGTAEATLRQLSGVVSPQQLAPLQAQWKLAPRGVKANVPQAAAFDSGGQKGDPAGSAARGSGDDPAQEPPADAPPAGLHTIPVAPPQSPAPATPPPDQSWVDQAVQWACTWVHCAKT